MNRRESLKAIGLGTFSASVLLDACKPKVKNNGTAATKVTNRDEEGGTEVPGRQDFEVKRTKGLENEKFFTDHEMKTITVLADIIIPKDDKSGSASDAGVPDFIEFIVKDMPEHKTPMRGGLRWIDLESGKRFDKSFVDGSQGQQIEIVNDIAYPEKAKPGMEQGVSFFSLMRDLTATGFFTSEIGIKDVGYMGNTPTQWKGVPEDVIKAHGLENVSFG